VSFKCSTNECNGILSKAFKCGVCKKSLCKYCLKPKNQSHSCKTTCPDCGEVVTKRSADTMQCYINGGGCGRRFSWKIYGTFEII
jgi:hypothetical protein